MVGASTHVSSEEIRQLAGVAVGDRLLAVDPDAVATRVTTHPWILSARVRRELPSALVIDVTERRAVASALLGALYLVDGTGHPFKRATFAEADGLPVITGVTRDQYATVRGTSEAVFRQALELFAAYDDGHPDRPKLSEIHVDTRTGFSLILFEGERRDPDRPGRLRGQARPVRSDLRGAGPAQPGGGANRVPGRPSVRSRLPADGGCARKRRDRESGGGREEATRCGRSSPARSPALLQSGSRRRPRLRRPPARTSPRFDGFRRVREDGRLLRDPAAKKAGNQARQAGWVWSGPPRTFRRRWESFPTASPRGGSGGTRSSLT